MSKVLVIGAGGVGSVAVHKMAVNCAIFGGISLASRTLPKCEAIAASVRARTGVDIDTYAIDAEEIPALTRLIERIEPKLVVNLALPYQDLAIMEACLATGVDYLDTANYEPRHEAKFEYHWQWAYQDLFAAKGLMALLGSGFDPGVTSVFAMWLKKHKLRTIRRLDILDCNGGDHGQAFATNFNPEINIREVTAPARHWEKIGGGEGGQFVETPAMGTKRSFDFEGVGPKNMYLMYHEELESLARFIPELERARFWMTFGDAYIQHLTVLQNVGMTRIDPVLYEGRAIVPLQFLKAVLPEPASLGATTVGKTNIGDIATGEALDGSGEKTFYINNICDHEAAFAETGNQAVSYTTGVPAMIGAALMLTGAWRGEGVFNIEQLDPDPFMAMLNAQGLPWQVKENGWAGGFLMETKAGEPGAFAAFDLRRVDSPAFVVDVAKLRGNLAVLADVRDRAGIKVLAALKAFSLWAVAPVMAEYLDGVCASGLWEARLASEKYSGEVATYCAAYKAEDLGEICALSDHVIFNSPGQIARFSEVLAAAGWGGPPGLTDSAALPWAPAFAGVTGRDGVPGKRFDVGLRINPLHAEGEVARYDPCAPHSRLGFPVDQLRAEHLVGVTGLHFHTLCEQDFAPLERTWAALWPRIAPLLGGIKWLNFGGGHHITRGDYDREALVAFLRRVKAQTGCEVYLEPGEAVALDAGILVGTVLDVAWNGMALAITDISATCHMPDVIEAPYRPALLGEGEAGAVVRLGGPSCLAGDVIGDYRMVAEVGGRFAFLDQAHYSMVKTTTFNGVPLPSIWLWDPEDDSLRCVRRFDYADFMGRLS